MVELTVQEWNDFNRENLIINDEDIWGNWYLDECCLIHNGEELEDEELTHLSPSTIITVDGVFCHYYMDSRQPLIPVIEAWRKQKTTAVVTVEIKKENLDQLREIIKQLDGKVIP